MLAPPPFSFLQFFPSKVQKADLGEQTETLSADRGWSRASSLPGKRLLLSAGKDERQGKAG